LFSIFRNWNNRLVFLFVNGILLNLGAHSVLYKCYSWILDLLTWDWNYISHFFPMCSYPNFGDFQFMF
jgi:hypothetical protein